MFNCHCIVMNTLLNIHIFLLVCSCIFMNVFVILFNMHILIQYLLNFIFVLINKNVKQFDIIAVVAIVHLLFVVLFAVMLMMLLLFLLQFNFRLFVRSFVHSHSRLLLLLVQPPLHCCCHVIIRGKWAFWPSNVNFV